MRIADLASIDINAAIQAGEVGETVTYSTGAVSFACVALFADEEREAADRALVADEAVAIIRAGDLVDGSGAPVTPARYHTVTRADGTAWTVQDMRRSGATWRLELERRRRPVV